MSSFEMHTLTDVGVKRSHNEDCVGADPAFGFAVLADGMGGHNAGEVASSMAVDLVSRVLQERLPKLPEGRIDDETGFTGESILVRHAVGMANNAILETSQTRPECAGMGTTIVAAVFYADRLTAAHVGDSRMYRLRDDLLTHVTEDHSLIQEQVRRGLLTADDARNSSIKNLVTRALGIEPNVEPDIVEDIVRQGDIYLMCSDGLTDVVPDEAIRLTLTQYAKDLRKAASQLVQLANDAGGPDNISVILVRTGKVFQRKRGIISRMFGR
ncbi:MAG TPA: Stp1/IreP family PP2C-type Ser/Thr phosphatase [Mariprofundaceae bacterium]|nr:Stp1/IreP family PP2C-type Ser/Thr phosphatase [Mariprofundaceae bacterium]